MAALKAAADLEDKCLVFCLEGLPVLTAAGYQLTGRPMRGGRRCLESCLHNDAMPPVAVLPTKRRGSLLQTTEGGVAKSGTAWFVNIR